MQKKQEFESRLLELNRVTRVTAGGRQFRFRALVVVGNKIGKVGVGIAKGNDASEAIEKATKQAKKKVITVPIKGGTIPFDITIKYHSVKIFLRPQKKGMGIIAGGIVRVICDLAGISNVTGKLISKTNNKVNISRATIKAFEELGELGGVEDVKEIKKEEEAEKITKNL